MSEKRLRFIRSSIFGFQFIKLLEPSDNFQEFLLIVKSLSHPCFFFSAISYISTREVADWEEEAAKRNRRFQSSLT
jgi:hypothetical protein